jgi:hypothetical protein
VETSRRYLNSSPVRRNCDSLALATPYETRSRRNVALEAGLCHIPMRISRMEWGPGITRANECVLSPYTSPLQLESDFPSIVMGGPLAADTLQLMYITKNFTSYLAVFKHFHVCICNSFENALIVFYFNMVYVCAWYFLRRRWAFYIIRSKLQYYSWLQHLVTGIRNSRYTVIQNSNCTHEYKITGKIIVSNALIFTYLH